MNPMDEPVPSRRRVLRGALFFGCGLLVPAALIGCDRKEAGTPGPAPGDAPAPQTGAMQESPPETGAMPEAPADSDATAPAAAAKVSQASVQYQDQPKGDQQCSGCLHFLPESNACKLVEGQISPQGWCVLWARKA